MKLEINKRAFGISILLTLFFLVFAFGTPGNALSADDIAMPVVTADVDDEAVVEGDPEVEEVGVKNQSQTPENPEDYLPYPLPRPVEDEVTTTKEVQESKWISYDLSTGEETVSDFPALDLSKELSLGDFVKGGPGVETDQETMGEDEISKNFGSLSFVNSSQVTTVPYRYNVKVFFTQGGKNYVCSGALIDPLHVITAGHCVHGGPGSSWSTNVSVAPAYHNGTDPYYGDSGATQLHSWTGWTNSGDWDHDVGVIDLNRPVGALTGWFGYGYSDNPGDFTGRTNYSQGYPSESPYSGQYQYHWQGTFDSTESILGVWYGNEVRFDRYCYGGQSGSGGYALTPGRVVFEVLSNGDADGPGVGDDYCDYVRLTSTKFLHIRDTWIPDDRPSSLDLLPLGVKRSPTSIAAGNQLSSMSYVVHNKSKASWSGTVSVRVRLSTNDLISTADTQIQAHSFSWSFGAATSVTVNVSTPPTIPFGTAPGKYYIGVIINNSDSNNGNNDSSGQDAREITVTPGGPVAECKGYCNSYSPVGKCWCDETCVFYGDCCDDVCDYCPSLSHCQAGGDCAGYCGGKSPKGCYCDNFCAGAGDCCKGVCDDCPSLSHCQAPQGCQGYCGGKSPAGCYCDSYCITAGDCCSDVCKWCISLPFC
jgi:V8-like Glu-specific endopeptidase